MQPATASDGRSPPSSPVSPTSKQLSQANAKEFEASFLPPVSPEDPTSEDVPFLALLNPRSGSRMGAKFLAEAAKFPVYRSRFFDIVEVATKPDIRAEFRRQLDNVKAETIRKTESQPRAVFRPRLICGGGDGTASFAIWCVLRTLHNEGGGFAWSDDELRRFFPAFVQMPLGTGNDLAGVLGWGRAINPSARKEVRAWMRAAVSNRSPVRPFDVWGILPRSLEGCKVCMLAGLESGRFPKFKQAGAGVPFLSLLYFSMGFEAFVAAQVELNRTESRIDNLFEYAKTIPASLLGDQRRNINLSGISIMVPDRTGVRNYFPPPHRKSTGQEYCSVGYMNINSIGGGVWAAKDAARYDDGLLDFFRQRNFLKNVLRRGNRYKTEKHAKAVVAIPGHLPGVHCQYDGEARFFFNPKGEDIEFDIRRVMQIPMVLGPDQTLAAPGEPAGPTWVVLRDQDADLPDSAFIPATNLQECKDLCVRHNFGAFCIRGGRAYFRAGTAEEVVRHLVPQEGSLLWLRDGTDATAFRLTGSLEERGVFRQRLEGWVTGQLAAVMTASQDEMAEVEARCGSRARGVCRRSLRAHRDFGSTIRANLCTSCGTRCPNQGCRGCLLRFCAKCFPVHLGDVPNVEWMYNDAGLLSGLARSNPLRWSARLCLDDVIAELGNAGPSRPIRVRVYVLGARDVEKVFDNVAAATSWLMDLRETDSERNQEKVQRDLEDFLSMTVDPAPESPAADTDSDDESSGSITHSHSYDIIAAHVKGLA